MSVSQTLGRESRVPTSARRRVRLLMVTINFPYMYKLTSAKGAHAARTGTGSKFALRTNRHPDGSRKRLEESAERLESGRHAWRVSNVATAMAEQAQRALIRGCGCTGDGSFFRSQEAVVSVRCVRVWSREGSWKNYNFVQLLQTRENSVKQINFNST